MAIELNRQTGEPVSPPGGFRGPGGTGGGSPPCGKSVPPGEQSTPVTLDNQVTLDYDHADPACRQAGQVYTSKSGNRGTYFRDPDGHLMEILTAIGGAPS